VKEDTYFEAMQRFATTLDDAEREGAVRTIKRVAEIFVVRPREESRALQHIDGIGPGMDTSEICNFNVAGHRSAEESSG
jgi:hypothetical protein